MPLLVVEHRITLDPALLEIVRQCQSQSLELIMSLSAKIAALSASVDAAIERVTDDVADLSGQIAELKAKVEAGLATPEDLKALDALTAKVDAIDPYVPAVLPPDEPTGEEIV